MATESKLAHLKADIAGLLQQVQMAEHGISCSSEHDKLVFMMLRAKIDYWQARALRAEGEVAEGNAVKAFFR